ncbi:High-affnity carbon uptake protein Hat/HatR [Fimbriiglobus ruber]|uniref:High-affnity carbon uptake protein Hat/HatR n=1 Tax=Fimbriiglobus ruber TaxID=1908690 RepID=A0A225CZ34_9BACT|nr:High-affnity carbon uptake protein Hat/HatR [Fimbriiglobus ruber]
MIDELSQDLREGLASLPRAHRRVTAVGDITSIVNRERHFLRQFPTALFQCLWNGTVTCADDDATDVRLLLDTMGADRRAAGNLAPLVRSVTPPRNAPTSAVRCVLRAHQGPVTCVAWSKGGEHFASEAVDGSIYLSDSERWSVALLTKMTDTYAVSLHWTTEETLLAVSADGRIVELEPTGEVVRPPFVIPTRGLARATLSTDEARLAVATADHRLIVCERSATSYVVTANRKCHDDRITGLSWSHDGTLIVTTSRDSKARVWDGRSNRRVKQLSCLGLTADAVAWSPDNRKLVIAFDRVPCLYDRDTWALMRELAGHEDTVTDLAWAPDGKSVACSSVDQSISVCDVGAPSLDAIQDDAHQPTRSRLPICFSTSTSRKPRWRRCCDSRTPRRHSGDPRQPPERPSPSPALNAAESVSHPRPDFPPRTRAGLSKSDLPNDLEPR